MTKKLIGLWNVQKELKEGGPKAIQKVSKKIADQANAKIKEDKKLLELIDTLVEWGTEHEIEMAKSLGHDISREEAEAGAVEYIEKMINSINQENKNMIYTKRFEEAIHFAIAVHEEPVKQKRKGKDVPYITHPLTVGLILSQAGASDDVVIAGIIHDTIEDCEPYGSVTKEMLVEKFGAGVAELVDAVSEKDKSLGWHERKEKALEEIKQFSHDALLVKSADVISNNTELIADYERDGETTFARFNAPKEESIGHTLLVINTITTAWPENPLVADLEAIASKLESIKAD